MNKLNRALFPLILLILLLNFSVSAQVVKKGKVERIKVHATSLEGNLIGDSPDRDVSIYLPASYASNPKKHYPVVYYLHGFTDNDAQWYGLTKHWINLPAILDSAYSKGSLNECIFVTPNGFTKFSGSWYSNSVTTGNWEDFVAKELVTYIDKHYRTIAKPSARGIAGHSMGGYGALRIGEKFPGTFSAVYLLSPAIFSPGTTPTATKEALDKIKTFEDLQKADFWLKALFSLAAAWSPNPDKPPFYSDLPGQDEANTAIQVSAKWMANLPLASLDQYIFNIKRLKGIGFDAGDQDVGIANAIKTLDKELEKYKIQHQFEIYKGNHINRIGNRINEKVLPFFSEKLQH